MSAPLKPHSANGWIVEDPPTGVLQLKGTTVPTDGDSGYLPGCIFQHTDGGSGTSIYVNEGTSSSCNFNALNVQGGAESFDADLTLGEGVNIITGTTTGTQIGEAAGQKIAFHGATPVAQAAFEADQGAMTTAGSNTGTSAAGLSLIGATNSGDVSGAIMNDFIALQEDIAALDAVVTAIRTLLINKGLMASS